MTSHISPQTDIFQFLGHSGEVSGIIRTFDWASTPLGNVTTWPQSLKTATALLLQSPVPIVMLWGEEGVMIYNDAYSGFAGHRHPKLFGSNVREGWSEIADFNDNVMKVGLSGRTLAYRDQELTLHRNGLPEQVWMDLDYSPVIDESGKPAGVIAIVVETTERVLAERRNREESQRLQDLFEQAPTFMAMVSGPDHRFVMINPEYRRVIGGRHVEGRSFAQALPEIAEQGYAALLDEVFRSGVTVRRMSERVLFRWSEGGPMEERFVDFVYQPIRDESGMVTSIFIQGSDVTERVRAENHQKLLINELNHRVKNTLASIQSIVSQTLRGPQTKEEASSAITARILALSRAHNILTDENWDGADLETMIAGSLETFQQPGRGTISIAGPKLRVGPHAALSIALAIHELESNAFKFGALSVTNGSVVIEWSISADGAFVLTWTEQDGPAVATGNRQGFGSRLLLRVLPIELSGSSDLDYRPSGIAFTLRTSLDAVSDRPAVEGA